MVPVRPSESESSSVMPEYGQSLCTLLNRAECQSWYLAPMRPSESRRVPVMVPVRTSEARRVPVIMPAIVPSRAGPLKPAAASESESRPVADSGRREWFGPPNLGKIFARGLATVDQCQWGPGPESSES